VIKLYRGSLFGLAICTLVLFFLTSQTWVSVLIDEPDFPALNYVFSGRELEPIIAGLLVVPATAVFGLIAAKGVLQRLVGLIVFLIGAILSALALEATANLNSTVDNLVSGKIGRTGVNYELTTNIYSNLLLLPALGVTVIGLLFVVRKFDLAKKRANYDRIDQKEIQQTPWQALDSGADPTLDYKGPQ